LSYFLLLVVAGCSASAPPPRPVAPSPISIAVPETYSAQEDKNQRSEGLGEICKIDPAACPTLDMEKEAARTFKEPLYAVSQAESGWGGIQLTGPLAGAPAVRSLRQGGILGQAVPAAPPSPPSAIPVKPARSARAELFDIEAKIFIQVDEVETSRTKLTELTVAAGGQVMNEVVENGPDRRGASLSLRIPSERVHAFLARMKEVGKVRSSSVETREVSRKIADNEVLVRNLERSLTRYEELLAKAANVTEANTIESELARVRTTLDRVRSDLEWAKDRVTRSTVYVTLSLEPEHAPIEPEAKLHPGIRAAVLLDVPPSDSAVPTTGFAGGGLSLQWTRTVSIDFDLLTNLRESGGGAIDFYVVTLGTDLYSDFFGGGRRTHLNPYFGFRIGFAHAPGQSMLPLGGTLGVDLYKTNRVLVGIETRAYAMLGRKQGADFVLEPAAGVNIAY
jgi:hypothetical protein